MTPRWLYSRLRAMGPREIVHRANEAIRERLHSLGFGNARPGSPSTAEGLHWVKTLPTQFATDSYRHAADEILEGTFHIYALSPCRLGFPPAWNQDPKTGRRAPLCFGKTMDYRKESLVGNIKYLWEPNRHLEVVTLAQAWHLTGDQKYAVGCRVLVQSWIEQCPYPRGPNWASSLELGIRLVNWSFAWHLLGGEASSILAGDEGERFKRQWLNAIYQHCHFLARYPSLHSSANNHLLGEMLGLLVGCLTWPKWVESESWASEAHRSFQREALIQNTSDGVNREQAIWYHHEVADMMIIAALVGRANGVEFSAEYWDRLEAMLEFVASVMDCAGNVPAFGDADDAVMVRFSPMADFHVFRSLLATGAVLFGRGDFRSKSGEFDDKSRWLLGDAAASAFGVLPAAKGNRLPKRAFPEGGYFVLGAEFETQQEVRVVVDAGPLGYPSIAAHGHADALSFTLSAAGREIIIDPGTYAYHTDPLWRQYFRGTRAHNTLCIDGQDQSVSGGNFLWTKHARVLSVRSVSTDEFQVLSAWHDGYKRLTNPAKHVREFKYSRQERVLRVQDRIVASGLHKFAMHLHFSESCEVVVHADHTVACAGEVRVVVTWPQGTTARLARGEEEPPLGWISRRFDRRQPTHTIVVSGEAHGPWSGSSEFRVLLPEEDRHRA